MSEDVSEDVPPSPADPLCDPARLAALNDVEAVGAVSGAAIDRYTQMAARYLDVPIALATAVHQDRQIFHSTVGPEGSVAEEEGTPLSGSFCKHVVRRDEPLAIEDTRTHPLVKDNPSVEAFGLLSYLGAPLVTPEGHVLGSFCVLGYEPRSWSEDDVAFIKAMAAAVMSEIQSSLADETFSRLDPEALLGPIVDNSLDGIVVLEAVYADEQSESDGDEIEDFVCRLVNEQAARILGHPATELMDKKLSEQLYDTFSVSKDEGHFDEYVRVAKTGEPYRAVVHHDREDIQGWFDLTAARWKEGVIASFHDITEQQEAQEQLRKTKEGFRVMAESMPQLVWTAQPDGSLDYANRRMCDYFGVPSEEVLDEGWLPMVHPDDADQTRAHWEQRLEAGERYEDKFRLCREDGTYRWHLARAVPQRNEERQIVKWFGTCTDIEEQRQLEQDLEKAREEADAANRAKSQFLANMSHELRTPLNAVIGYSEMVQEDLAGADAGDEEQQREQMLSDLGQIHSAGEQLLALVNDVLDISKIEAGEMELHPETFDVETMATGTAETIRPMIEEGGNRLTVDCAEEVGAIHTDKTKLRQALFNLLSNAAKFTEDGEITLRVHREEMPGGDPGFAFAVEDTGIGMTEEEQAEVFETFAQADTSLTRKHEGTGLGLVISQNLAEMMGGRLDLDSEKGVGSTFTLHLPVRMKRQRGSSEPEPTSAEAPAEAVAPKKPAAVQVDKPAGEEALEDEDVVLVIDDDERARQIIGRRLEKEGFTVRTASGGEEGLEAARALNPTVITLDVMMPEMDGWAVLSVLQNDEALQDIPVVMVTIVEDENMGYMLGASDYLTKPLDPDRLTNVLRKYRDDSQAPCAVLLAEDDAATRDLIRRTLEKEGNYAIWEAENGRDALEEIDHRERRPDVVILDLMMPNMDGFAFLERLRSHPPYRSIPVVVVTAKDLTAEDRKRLSGKVADILQKGDYAPEELLEKVRRRVTAAA